MHNIAVVVSLGTGVVSGEEDEVSLPSVSSNRANQSSGNAVGSTNNIYPNGTMRSFYKDFFSAQSQSRDAGDTDISCIGESVLGPEGSIERIFSSSCDSMARSVRYERC